MKCPLVLFLVLTVFLPVGGFGQAATPVTVYCDDGYFPYSYADGKVAKGAYVDLLHAAFAKLKGYKVTITPLPWKRGLALLESGEGFGIFPPYKRPDLRPWLDYVLKLNDEKVVLLLNTKGPIPKTAAWPADFQGKKIGLNEGFAFLDPWKDQVKIDPAHDNEMAIEKLAALRDDAYANDEIVMLKTAGDLKAAGKIPGDTQFVVGPTISAEEAFLSLSNVADAAVKFPFINDFRTQMKGILEAMSTSGETKKILDKYRS